MLLYGTKNKVDVRDFEHLSLLLKLDTAEADSILKMEQLLQSDQKELEGMIVF